MRTIRNRISAASCSRRAISALETGWPGMECVRPIMEDSCQKTCLAQNHHGLHGGTRLTFLICGYFSVLNTVRAHRCHGSRQPIEFTSLGPRPKGVHLLGG